MRLASLIAVAATLTVLVSSGSASAASPPRGNYMCWTYSGAYPLMVAQVYVFSTSRYAGPGRRNAGTYRLGAITRLGQRINFITGAYRGWWAYYRTRRGTAILDLFNRRGRVVDGACPRSGPA